MNTNLPAGTATPGVPRLRPRWNKALSDLWGNKVRSLLVIASVAVGLFAVGMIATIHAILTVDMRESYALTDPANILVSVDAVDDDAVDFVNSVDGVARAEGVRSFDIQARGEDERWLRMSLKAIPDPTDMQINRVALVEGVWPPGDREIVLERNKRAEIPVALGDSVAVELPSGKVRNLKLVGIVQDLTVGASTTSGGFFLAPAQGYITANTLEWLEQPDAYNLVYVRVSENGDDETHLRAIANEVSAEIEDNGGLVYNAVVHGTRAHPNASYTDAMAGVLYMLGALVVFLSAFLITNTLTALLNQQSQQIAVMKTIGARSNQVVGIYLALIFVYGLLALAVAVPLSRWAAFGLLDYLAGQINFYVLAYRTIPLAVGLQVIIALVMPQLAGLAPILRGARIKVQEALSGSLVDQDPEHSGWLDRRLARVRGLARFRQSLSRPMLISLRNTFRRKGRLILTLVTLSLGGAIFIATFVVRASLENYIERLGRYFVADINLNLAAPHRINEIQRVLSAVPGIDRVEGWAVARSELLLENDQAGDAVQLLGPPAGSILIDPILLSGRWVQPGDQNAVALSERFLSSFPGLKPGDTLRLRVNGRDSEWVVVGFFQLAGKSAGFIAYANYEYLSEFIRQPNEAATYRVTAQSADLSIAEQRALGVAIETHLQAQGIAVSEVNAGKALLESSTDGLDLLTTFLLIMAVLTALVGSIGLMGTMSMNVLDRTREIGVMRAIGASDRSVTGLVIVEGVLIGLISWLTGTVLSIPIGKVMSDVVTHAIFEAPSRFTFSLIGPAAWLAVVIVLSILASVVPARSAARITIREALAYE